MTPIPHHPERQQPGPRDPMEEVNYLARMLDNMDVPELQERIREDMGTLTDQIWANESWRERLSAEYSLRNRSQLRTMLGRLKDSLHASAQPEPDDTELSPEDTSRRRGLFQSLLEKAQWAGGALWRHKGKVLLGVLGIALTARFWQAMWNYLMGFLHKYMSRISQGELERGMKLDASLHRPWPEVPPLENVLDPMQRRHLGMPDSFGPGSGTNPQPLNPPYQP